jgi:hypothetical protein
MPTTQPLSINNPARNNAPAGGAITANNARDIAAAQPDTVITGGARDLDLGDDGSGGGGGAHVQMLNTQNLGDMLQAMGVKADFNQGFFTVHIKAKIGDITYSYPVKLYINDNRTLLWISCGVGSIDKGGVSGESLMNLLVANSQLAPTFFVVDPQVGLLLQRAVTNSGITPDVLGYNLKMFINALKGAEPVYRSFLVPDAGGSGGGGGQGGGGGGSR